MIKLLRAPAPSLRGSLRPRQSIFLKWIASRTRNDGISLLETLLVILIISVITISMFSAWPNFSRQLKLREIKSDIAEIKVGLAQYFATKGCNSDGSFSGSPAPTMDDLGLPNLNNKYQTQIISYENNRDGKPLYRFLITTHLNNFKFAQLQLLANELHAQAENNTLIWQIPYSALETSQTWMLNNGLQTWRNQQQGNYCAQ